MAYHKVQHYLNNTVGQMLLDPTARFLFGAGGGGVTSLTTTGSSGPATLVAGVLNIPDYSTGGSVTSVSGTTNRITVTGTTTPTVDIAATYVGQTSITTVGTITTGTWNGGVLAGQYGGTGVANTGLTITLAGNLVTSGANSLTLTTTGSTNVTLPTSGTLVNSAVTTLSSLVSVGTITTGVWNGTAIADGNIATSYIKADGTRALTGNWGAGAFSGTFNSVGIGTAANQIALGTASGGNGTITSTTNATKGKVFFGSANASYYDEANEQIRVVKPSLGVTATETNGVFLQNTTAAAAGAQQISPAITLEGQGWKTTATAASARVNAQIYLLPVQGSANPTSQILFATANTGGSYTTLLTLDSTGGLLTTTTSGLKVLANNTGAGGLSFVGTPSANTITGNNGFKIANAQTLSAAGTLIAIDCNGVAALASGNAIGIGLASTSTTFISTGSGTFAHLDIPTTITQTGGGTGITRSIYIHPTLTNAADYRAIEVAIGRVVFAATATTYASFNLPAGTAPTSPNDGDVWREDNTNTGLKIRVNGVTKTISLV